MHSVHTYYIQILSLLSTFVASFNCEKLKQVIHNLTDFFCVFQVDCWSLGVVLYAMMYKTMPFLGGDFNELRQQISEGDYYEPSNRSG